MKTHKICTRCKENKLRTEFYTKDKTGLVTARCKECTKFLVRVANMTEEQIARRSERNRKSTKKRRLEPGIRQARKKMAEKYNKTEKGKATIRKVTQNRRKNYPQVYKATNAVNNAVATNKIPCIHDMRCTKCGKQAENYHHPNGYDEANKLDVIPLCREDHLKEHGKQLIN